MFLAGIGEELLLKLHGSNHVINVSHAACVRVVSEARNREHDVIFLHEVADTITARENRSKTAGNTEFASRLAGAQSKWQPQGGVLKKWYPFSFFFCGHHQAEQMAVASLAPASSFRSFHVGANGFSQHFASSCRIRRFFGLFAHSIDKLAGIGSGGANGLRATVEKKASGS